MPQIAQDNALDSSLAFYREGYEFFRHRHRQFHTDIFQAKLLGKTYNCVFGEDAARMFYEPDRFTRQGALPSSTLKLLQDEGSVAVLDAEAHAQRKQMFLSLMTPERLRLFAQLASEVLLDAAADQRSQNGGVINLDQALRGVLCDAACRWIDIRLERSELQRLTGELGAMIDNAGTIGPANWTARIRRWHSEQLLRHQVERVRAGSLAPRGGSGLEIIASHREPDGQLLAPEICAVELLNVLRPIVAISRFMTFAALALHQHSAAHAQLRCDDAFLEPFVQEVRRLTPFFPVVAGIAREDFGWRDYRFGKGDRFALDLYGTNRDPRAWDDPEAFRPERFIGWRGNAFTMIPQGGGDFVGHRCAGEWLTIAVMTSLMCTLVRKIEYELPEQDLTVDLSRIPAAPKSGFVIDVKSLH
ncbi:cytochrome P450 [Bradyrhizobium sp. ORS 86]|uniref:cytochrome P450 n=1 Tax=Bradyrhizobium sp. ORS 86 TaxID=1685970 RepID=UPI00388F7F2A